MRMLASFTIDSRHRRRRSRSSWYAKTPCSEMWSTYAVIATITLRTAALISSASPVSRGSSSRSRSRTTPCASLKARSIALTGVPCRASRRARARSAGGGSIRSGSIPCARPVSPATMCSATLADTSRPISGSSHRSGTSRRRHRSTSAIRSPAREPSSCATRDTRPSASRSTVSTLRLTGHRLSATRAAGGAATGVPPSLSPHRSLSERPGLSRIAPGTRRTTHARRRIPEEGVPWASRTRRTGPRRSRRVTPGAAAGRARRGLPGAHRAGWTDAHGAGLACSPQDWACSPRDWRARRAVPAAAVLTGGGGSAGPRRGRWQAGSALGTS